MPYHLFKHLEFVLYPVLSFLLSTIITKKLIKILPVLGFIDSPRENHIHEKPVPTSGGIAIVVSFFITSMIFLFFWKSQQMNNILSSMTSIYIPFILLVLIGIIDDKFNINYKIKLILQIFITSLCWFSGIKFTGILGYSFHPVLSYIFTVLWLFFFINGFNLIDGLDGIAAGLGSVSSFCMGIIFILDGKLPEAVILFILAGSALGFLRYNFHPAKIFMGDVGSMGLGFMIGALGILFSTKAATATSVLVPIVAAGIPWFDGFLALWRRLSKKILTKMSNTPVTQKMLDRDIDHIHHRLFKRHKNQIKTAQILYAFSLLSAIIAILLTSTKGNIRYLAFLILIILIVASIKKLAYWELWNSSQIVASGLNRVQKKALPIILEPILDFVFIFIAYFIVYLLFNDFKIPLNKTLFCKNFIIFIFPIIVAINISRIYRTYWLRSSIEDYIYLIQIIFIGFFISFITVLLYSNMPFFYCLSFFCLAYAFSAFFILGERLFINYMKYYFVKKAYLATHQKEQLNKTLIYGGGINCRYYLFRQFKDIESPPENIIGILDDFKRLKNQHIYGHKVLGYTDDIEEIYKKYKFQKIVIAANNIEKEKLEKVKNFCKDKDIIATRAIFSETQL